MSAPLLPLVVEPVELQARLGDPKLLLVDLSRPQTYAQGHLPGAVHLDYARLVAARPPAMGLLPERDHLSRLFGSLGLTPDRHVVAYDDEGGGRAARLLWTLDVIGHARHSLLNGVLFAWMNEGRPLDRQPAQAESGAYPVDLNGDVVADRDYILGHLRDPGATLLDARSAAEYSGAVVRAARGGHIPGAVNFDWLNAIDRDNGARLRPVDTLKKELSEIGVTPDREAITYCQTHHRSAHSYFVLKYLGYPRIRGYPGSWSEWGNDPNLPIE